MPSGEHWLGLVTHPRHAAFASLRATTEDIAGNRGEVSIIRAYQIADRSRRLFPGDVEASAVASITRMFELFSRVSRS